MGYYLPVCAFIGSLYAHNKSTTPFAPNIPSAHDLPSLISALEESQALYSKLKFAYKTQMGMIEVMQRQNESMKDRMMQVEARMQEHAYQIREIDICRDIIMYAEQSERIATEKVEKKLR